MCPCTRLSPNTSGDTVRIGDGSAGTPSYGFTSQTNLGMFRSGADTIGWGAAGSVRMTLDGNEQIVFGRIKNTLSGSASGPSISRSTDDNTGIFYPAFDQWAVSTGGIQKLLMRSENSTFNGSLFINSIEQVCTSENALCFENLTGAGFFDEIGGILEPNNTQNINMNQGEINNVSLITLDVAGDIGFFNGGSLDIGAFADSFVFDPSQADNANFMLWRDVNSNTKMRVDLVTNATQWNMDTFNITPSDSTTDVFRVNTEGGANLFSVSSLVPAAPGGGIIAGTPIDMEANSIFDIRELQGRATTSFTITTDVSSTTATRDMFIATSDENPISASNVNRMAIRSGAVNPDIDMLTNVDINTFNVSNARFLSVDGVLGTPSLTFINDSDTGFFLIASNTIGVTFGGLNQINISDVIFNTNLAMFINGSEVCTPGNGACNGDLLPWTNDTSQTFIKSTFPQTVNISDLITGNLTGNSTLDGTGLTLAGDARYVQIREIPSNSVGGGGLNPPGESVINNIGFVLDFGSIQEEEVFFNLIARNNIDTSEDANITIIWSASDASAGSVVWCAEFVGLTPESGDTFGNTTTTLCIADAASGTTDEIQETGPIIVAGGAVTAGDFIPARIFRQVGNATDDYGADAQLSIIKISTIADTLGGVV